MTTTNRQDGTRDDEWTVSSLLTLVGLHAHVAITKTNGAVISGQLNGLTHIDADQARSGRGDWAVRLRLPSGYEGALQFIHIASFVEAGA